jgi:hypothetical protein
MARQGTKTRRSSTKRKSSSSGRKSTRTDSASSSSSSSNSRARARRRKPSSNGGASGARLSDLAAKARLPLIAGGAALAGAVGGMAARRRAANRSTGPVAKLRQISSSLPVDKVDLRKLDLETVKAAGERMTSLGQQTVDITTAVEKTRKKHN